MLVLKRKEGESLVIKDDRGNVAEINIINVQDGRVKIGIEAPKEMRIFRTEVLEQAKEDNKESMSSKKLDLTAFKDFKVNKN